jgi:ceramide glucosyltransferase
MDALTYACWGLVGLALFQTVLTLIQTWDHRRFHRTRLACAIPMTDRPRVMLFVPCKGLELGLEAQLEAFFTQDYTNYEICFVIESADDPALAMIDGVRRRFSAIRSHVVVAGLATDSGQKCRNLMVATTHFLDQSQRAAPGSPPVAPCEHARQASDTSPRFHDSGRQAGHASPRFDVFAFSDSDARPVPSWLGTMIGRMAITRPIVTGYRWMVPQRPTFANRLVSALSNQLAGVAGPRISTLVWGGSWVVRTDAFAELGLPEAWRGTLSDDLTVSRLARASRMKVIYEPRCLVPSPVDVSLAGMFEFARRQFLIARVYTPAWWALAIGAAGVTMLVYAGSAVLTVLSATAGGTWMIPAASGLGYYAANVLKSHLRWGSVRPFVRVSDREFRTTTVFETWASPLVAAVALAALLLAMLSRRLTWRGITYRLDSATRTRIERRDEPAASRGSEPAAGRRAA